MWIISLGNPPLLNNYYFFYLPVCMLLLPLRLCCWCSTVPTIQMTEGQAERQIRTPICDTYIIQTDRQTQTQRGRWIVVHTYWCRLQCFCELWLLYTLLLYILVHCTAENCRCRFCATTSYEHLLCIIKSRRRGNYRNFFFGFYFFWGSWKTSNPILL